jgi:hypothetical protein
MDCLSLNNSYPPWNYDHAKLRKVYARFYVLTAVFSQMYATKLVKIYRLSEEPVASISKIWIQKLPA